MAVDLEHAHGLGAEAPRRRSAYSNQVANIALLSAATAALWAGAGSLWVWSAQQTVAPVASSAEVRLAQATLRRDDEPAAVTHSPVIAMATLNAGDVETGAEPEPATVSAAEPVSAVFQPEAEPAPSAVRITPAEEGALVEIAGIGLEPYWAGRREEDTAMAEIVSISPDSSLADALCVGDAIVTVGSSSLSGLTGDQLAESFEDAVMGARKLDFALLVASGEDGERRSLQVQWGEHASPGLESRFFSLERRECAS